MARPRKDSEVKGAEQRMVEAFWSQLSRMPYRKVTAASIARQKTLPRKRSTPPSRSASPTSPKSFSQETAHRSTSISRRGSPSSAYAS